MKKAVIYARYSSSTQTEQSIEGQVRVCTDYAKAKDMEIVGEYIDRAISGRTDNRPDFQRLMADCTLKLFDAVIVYKTDRFARDKYDSVIYKRQLRKAGIEIHYAAEAIPEGAEGIILESLMEGLAEYYSAELAQKIRRGMRESAAKGHCTGGSLALGYDIGSDKSFVINENEAQLVRDIFKMFNRGISNAAICQHMNSLGFKTSRGNEFTKSSIPRIIKNVKYIGVYKCGDVRIENSVPAIVSREVFYIAQNELEKRKTRKRPKSPKAEYLLIGKLFCGHCKKGVSGTGRSGNKFYYYYCPDARAKKGCTKKHVSRDWIEDLVVEETVKHILRPDVIKHISTRCYEIQLEDQASDDTIAFLERKLVDNKKALANTLRAIETGVITKTLPARLQELEIEQVQVEDELKRAKAHHIVLTPEKIEFMLLQFTEAGDDPEKYKKKNIESFVSSVYLYDDKLIIYYNIRQDHTELASSNLEPLEGVGVFDQRCNASTIKNRMSITLLRFFLLSSCTYSCRRCLSSGLISQLTKICTLLHPTN